MLVRQFSVLFFAAAEVKKLITGRDDNGRENTSRDTVILVCAERLIEEECVYDSLVDYLGSDESIDGPAWSGAEGYRAEHIAEDEKHCNDASLEKLGGDELILSDVSNVEACRDNVHVDLRINSNIE